MEHDLGKLIRSVRRYNETRFREGQGFCRLGLLNTDHGKMIVLGNGLLNPVVIVPVVVPLSCSRYCSNQAVFYVGL